MRRFHVVAPLLCSIAVLLGACGHGQRGMHSASAAPSTAGSNQSDDARLHALIAGFNSKTFKISANTSASGPVSAFGGAGDAPNATAAPTTPEATTTSFGYHGTIRLIQRGSSEQRTDSDFVLDDIPAVAGSANAERLRITGIVHTTSVLLCMNDVASALIAFGAIPPNKCVAEDAGTQALVSSLTDPAAGLLSADLKVTGTSGRNIAGVAATCYRAMMTKDDAHGEIDLCFSADGLEIAESARLSTPAGPVMFSTEATSVSTAVTDADFTPPYPLATTFSLKVRDDSKDKITVIGNAHGSDLNDGEVDIEAGATGTLHTGFRGNPESIEITSYDGGWYFTCDWADAKAHELIVVTLTTATFANGSPRPVPHANCAIIDVSPSAPAPTAVPRTPGPGGFASSIGVLSTPTPAR